MTALLFKETFTILRFYSIPISLRKHYFMTDVALHRILNTNEELQVSKAFNKA